MTITLRIVLAIIAACLGVAVLLGVDVDAIKLLAVAVLVLAVGLVAG